jgi:Tol biopolymer transport system component
MRRIAIAAACLAATILLPATPSGGAATRGATALVSLRADGSQTRTWSVLTSIDARGRFVAFTTADPLVPGDTDRSEDVYLRDTKTGVVTRVSLAPDGEPFEAPSYLVAVAPMAHRVAFLTRTTRYRWDVYVRDLRTQRSQRVAHGVRWAAISRSFRYLALAYGDEGCRSPGPIVLRDLATHEDLQVLRRDTCSWAMAVSDDGDVAFDSTRRLTTDDRNDGRDVYLWGRSSAEIRRVSALRRRDIDASMAPALTPDGATVVFWASAWTFGVSGHFAWDRATGTLTRLSHEAHHSEQWVAPSSAVTPDGRFVAFAARLPHDDSHVLLVDRDSMTTETISVSNLGFAPRGRAAWPSISADGRYVAFTSGSALLVAGDANGAEDVFVRDRRGIPPSTGAPDLSLRPKGETEWFGEGIAEPDQGYGMALSLLPGERTVVRVRMRNVGTATDPLTLRGGGSNAWSIVTFRSSGVDVTDQVLAGTFVANLAPGEISRLGMHVHVLRSAPSCRMRSLTIGALATTDPWADALRMDVAVPC